MGGLKQYGETEAGRLLCPTPPDLLHDTACVARALLGNGMAVRYIPTDALGCPEVALTAVTHNGPALAGLPDEM